MRIVVRKHTQPFMPQPRIATCLLLPSVYRSETHPLPRDVRDLSFPNDAGESIIGLVPGRYLGWIRVPA